MANTSRIPISTLLLTTFLAAPGLAAPIPIDNFSFEDDALPDGGVTSTVTGWSSTAGGGDGAFDATAAEYPGGVPHGENVGYVNGPGNFLFQQLPAVLAPNTTYTLTVRVGRKMGSAFAGYRIQLLAGSEVLAEDDSTLSPAEGQFLTSTVVYKAVPGQAFLGDPLAIQLLAPGVQANFDLVQLDASPCCLIRPPTMTAWWPLDELAPATAADIVGAHDGRHVNGPTPTLGVVDGALSFDGLDDYVEVGHHPELDAGTGDFSVDAWVRTTDSTGVVTLLGKRTNDLGGTRGYSLYLFDGDLGFQLADGDGSSTCSTDPIVSSCTNWVASSPGSFVADGEWHHVAVTVDRDHPSGLVFYVDGVQVGSFDPTIRAGSLDNDGVLRLGARAFAETAFLDGVLDEVELFHRALAPSEVAALHDAGIAGKCKVRVSMDWDIPVCRNADVSRPSSIEICNDSTTGRILELTFLPVPGGACGSIDGPDSFFLTGPPVIAVPPAVNLLIQGRTCTEVPFEAVRPAQMTQNRLIGCFDVVLIDTATGEELRKRSSLQDWRECCTAGPRQEVAEVPPGGAATVRFPVINTSGGDLTFDFRVEAMPPEGTGGSLLSLDGEPPGTPATGVVTFADQETVEIALPVAFAGETGLLTEDLILWVDTGGGDFQALASTRARARLATDIFEDGFESRDTDAWSQALP
ncbi:MAG: LamG domain-containing protein [Holophagales bacterium]|nr:LamG domain-containing protein [Holophagales bacterium]